jgi:hypothetical protein
MNMRRACQIEPAETHLLQPSRANCGFNGPRPQSQPVLKEIDP